MKKSTKTKAPPKLSPQEGRVLARLMLAKKMNYRALVQELYCAAKDTTVEQASRVPHRRRQQHVGVLVARINKKRRRTMIVPGGDHTYVIRRRR